MTPTDLLAAIRASNVAVHKSIESLRRRVVGDLPEPERVNARAAAHAAGLVVLDEVICEEMARNAAQVVLCLIEEGWNDPALVGAEFKADAR